MRILGIDPGTFKMGVGVVDAEGGRLCLAYSAVLSPPRADPLSQRLSYIYEQLVQLTQIWQPTAIAIEEPFVARNVRSAMAVGQAQAVAMVAAAHHALPVACYSPREVKRAVTDYGASSKEQVQEMVRLLLGLREESGQPLDETDALAVAICHINSSQVQELAIRE